MSEKKSPNTSIAEKSDEIDLSRYWGALIDHKWLIIGVTSIFTLIGISYSIFSTPIYKADALIQVEQNSASSLLSSLSDVLPSGQPRSAAEIEIIQSRMVIGKTVNDLSLDTVINVKYFPVFGEGLSRLFGAEKPEIAISRLDVPSYLLNENFELNVVDKDNYTILLKDGAEISGKVGKLLQKDNVTILVSGISASPGTIFEVRKQSELLTINQVLDNLTVADKGKDTGVLSLSLEGAKPEKIRNILDSISNNYLQQNVERKSEEAAKSLVFLKEQLPAVRNSLDMAEDKLNNFRQVNDSVDLSLEAKSLLDTMVSVETQLNESTFKEAEVSKLYTKEHPAYKALLEKRNTLADEKEKLNKRIASMPKTQQEILRLTRDVQSGQEIYMQLLNKQQELNINKASTVGNVRIIDKTVTQPKPIKPRKLIIVVLSLILGVLFSVSCVILKTILHRGIANPEELEALGINVYANIPLSEWQQRKDREFSIRNKHKRNNVKADELLAVGNPADLAIEAIRSLRTSLHFAMMEAKNNVLMISGASPAIGKTFVSANLAAVIAQSGQRVLVIDGDMRKGYAHELMGTTADRGLSDILSNQISKEQAIRKTNVDNMDFLPRGQIPPNPSELLMHNRLTQFIEWASETYDIVLVDTPPILAVTDAAIISRHAGTSLLVARFEVNTLKEVEVSIRRFEQNGAEIKGIILNAVVKKAASYYGGYGYYAYEYKSDK
ncbi:tyrosine-protein kinase Wzc [Serratia fonticola]|uniref:tyrosine-protein kinase Wzc n=1 Tax=Serratia fonticola TaxID=47917 RepID=UPI003AAC48AC